MHTQRISTAAEAFSALRSPDFDPERNVIVERDIEKNLQPAFSATVTVDFGPTLIVRAMSPGHSLLVLPFEYSNCLHVTAKLGQPQLMPVNLQQTGLIFENSVEAEITYRFGLFNDSSCRGKDRKRADDLRLTEALVDGRRLTFYHKRPTLPW